MPNEQSFIDCNSDLGASTLETAIKISEEKLKKRF